MTLYRVLEQMDDRNPHQAGYPLLPGDIISKLDTGVWMKHAPGLGVFGFELSEEDVTERLEEAPEASWVIA